MIDAELRLASRALADGLLQTELSVPGIHCGGCVNRIEKAVGELSGVANARVNLSTRRLTVRWRGKDAAPPLFETLKSLGFEAHLNDQEQGAKDPVLSGLIRAMAVAGFGAGNIMLFSVAIWAGAESATRDLFHWFSAIIAIFVLGFSGRMFYRSAWSALRHGRTNMDVPISIGVSLAFVMSFYDTLHHGEHAYFDASVTLLFFLLIGRTLDHAMREKARGAVAGLARLAPRGATVIEADGTRHYRPIAEIVPGMTLILPAGDRVPVDSEVLSGSSEIDCALVNGEPTPRLAEPGGRLLAGTLNLTGPLILRATAAAKDSFLAEMVRLMEAAEAGRGRYRRIADRASRLYAPAVHLAALLCFAYWLAVSGDWHHAATLAVAVLIITCPCALGLAVPMVQMAAARRLFEQGIMIKDGAGLERLTEIDHVVFDKTGTLTSGVPSLIRTPEIEPWLPLAAGIGAHSRHPRSQALAAASAQPQNFDSVSEIPGVGVEARSGSDIYRLGAALSVNGREVARFAFEESLRPGARECAEALRAYPLEILSGDQAEAVQAIAGQLAISQWHAGMDPAAKVAHLQALAQQGRKVLMVGDGLNDAPALMAAHASFAPAEAADVGRNAADFVFLRGDLRAVPATLALSRNAARLIRQNFALAIGYNILALPLAVTGHVSPLLAAIAMSLSSIIVVANALRLRG